MAGEAESDRIGGGLNHSSQDYPFVTRPRVMRRSTGVALFCCLGLLLSACVADDSPIAGEEILATQTTPAPDSSTTTASTAAAGTEETEPLESETTTTVPEILPDPEWAGTDFVLESVAATDGALAMAVRAGSEDLWFAERRGRVVTLSQRNLPEDAENQGEGETAVVLDISDKVGTDGEGGLLGLDFSADGGLLYVSYTDTGGTSVIAEYRMEEATADESSERVLLTLEQPYANHNGGQISFGPDGHLYVAFGDGGSGGDPLGSGQDTSTLLGSILRIDPSGGSADSPYGVPADNPFAGGTGDDQREEIWIYGVRNPWRFSFDAATGDLWIGDVGQGAIEEIDFLPATAGEPAGRGANLGWNIMEGEEPFSGETPPPDLIGPIAWYGHDNGRCSVTGGHVYRGSPIAELDGVYLFGDFCTGEVFGLKRFSDGRTTQAPLAIEGGVGQIVSFGEGPAGELYVFESNGTVSRLGTQG